ncbi:CHAT domain-containing protein [Lewinella sp. IMCC34191]|uniref:CHAT domain-containing protein n=1 Tax=Lewinella sp. IMCC34191 TaxID=2259172 RepID=UPI000E2290FC|nr:CHAT domain-containing tetratricopeptide repeat protein [Lewinella sp. IMCC34191]
MYACIRLLLLALALLVVSCRGWAQNGTIDSLVAKEAYGEAARVLKDRMDRKSRYAEGLAYIDADSTEAALRNLAAVTHDRTGKPIIDSLAGRAFHKMGLAAYNAMRDSLAAAYYQKAIAVGDSVYPTYHNDRAHSRANLATVLYYLNQVDSAIVLVREANTIYERVPVADSLNWLRNINTLGRYALITKNYRLGYSSSFRAVSLMRQLSVDPKMAFYTYSQASNVLLRLAELEPALKFAQESLTYALSTNDALSIADAYNQLALVLIELDRQREGLQNLRRAERYATAAGHEEMLGIVYLNLAEYYGERGDTTRLNRYDELARNNLSEADKLGVYLRSEKVPAIRLRLGQTRRALASFSERLTYLTGGKEIPTGGNLPEEVIANAVPIMDMLGHRAEAYTNSGMFDNALEDYRALFRIQGHLRRTLNDYESQSYLSQDQRRFYDRAIALLLDLYREEDEDDDLWEAYQLSERARAYSLLASVQSEYVGIPPEISSLQEEISRLEREVSLGQIEQREVLSAARIRMDQLQADRLEENPISFLLKRKDLNSFVKKNKFSLLQYHLSEQNTVLFLLTPQAELRLFFLDLDEALDDRVHNWRETIETSQYRFKSMAAPEVQAALDSNYLHQGLMLTDLLLPPAAREALNLRSAAEKKARVCVIPDGVLNYLPFAALPLRESPLPLDYSEVEYLQSAADVSYSYSSSYLLAVSEGRRNDYEKNFVAFAPSFRSTAGETANGTQSAKSVLRSNASLAPLVYSTEEVARVVNMVADAVAYYDERADVAEFRSEVGKARVLHISSHGYVDPTDPNLSFIAFSQTGEQLDKDELLYFNDLYGMRIDNELTVLSACETAVGKLAPGETTMSMASAFAAAGARSTLTTLWQVDDAATKNLVVSFYRQLVQGKTRLESLNTAQREMRELDEYAHPYYWSGLTLYGASSPIELLGKKTTLSTFAWAVLWALALGVLVLFIYVGRGRKPLPHREG